MPLPQTRDNRITNRLVRQGQLPKSRLEIYPQRKPRARRARRVR